MKIRTTALVLAAVGLALAAPARAQVTINFVYDGTDTTVNFGVAAGSFSSFTLQSANGAGGTEHDVRAGGLVSMADPTVDIYNNPGYTNSIWGSNTVATSYSGDTLRFFEGSSGVRVPIGFDINTDTLAGTMTWTGTSLMDLGFASNATTSGSFAGLGTIINWSATNTAIPEPSTCAAFAGLSVIGLAAWRRRRRAA